MLERIRRRALALAACLALAAMAAHGGTGAPASPGADQGEPGDQPGAAGEAQAPPSDWVISRADVDAAWREAEKVRKQDNIQGARAMLAFAARFPDVEDARQALYNAGVAFAAQRLRPEAIAAFQQYLARYPGHDLNDDALTQIISLLRQEQDYTGSAAAQVDFHRRFPHSPQAEQNLLAAAGNLQREGDYDGAVAAYQTLLKAYPNSNLCDDALYAMGQLYAQQFSQEARDTGATLSYEDYGPALRAYEAVERIPFSRYRDDAAYQLAYLYYQTNNPIREYEASIEALEGFMARYPFSRYVSQARNSVNSCLRSQKKPPRYDTNEPVPDPEALLRPAERLRALRRYPEVIVLYQNMIRQFAGHENQDSWMMVVGDVFSEAKDEVSAIRAWRAVVDTCVGSDQRSAAMLKIIRSLGTLKDTAGELQAKVDYIALFPTGANVERYWSDVLGYHRSARNIPTLLAVLQRVYTEFPDLDLADNAIFEAANIHQQLRRYGAAAALYNRLLQTRPGSDLAVHSLFLLARCQHESGDLTAARLTYQKVARALPNTGLADDALAQISVLETPAEAERVRLFREAPLPGPPPAAPEPAKWEAFKEPPEPLPEGVCGPVGSPPGAGSPLHLRFRMARQLPVDLAIKWLTGDPFANVQIAFNGQPAHALYVQPNTVTQVRLLATRVVEGVNTVTIASADNMMRWDCLALISDGLPPEREGRIALGVEDGKFQEFSAGAAMNAKLTLTEILVDLDERKWATRPDPEHQALKDAVAAATPAKGAKKPPDRTPDDVYREAFQLARGYYARGQFLAAARRLASLSQQRLPADIQTHVQALLLVAGDNARDYGLEEIRCGSLIILAPPSVAVQLRQYNVPNFFQDLLAALCGNGSAPAVHDPPFVVSLAAYPGPARAMYGRFDTRWLTTPVQWASLVPKIAEAWITDPMHAQAVAPAHPRLMPALAALAALQMEAALVGPLWKDQEAAAFAQRRSAVIAASANVSKSTPAEKMATETVAGWLLRLALGPEFSKSEPTDLGWQKLGPLLSTLRALPPHVVAYFAKPPERAALVIWALGTHLGKDAIPQLAYIGLQADEKTLARVTAAMEKLTSTKTAENQ
ncbi:MAG: tetratricopeptide repeat protein [Armatimonadetes bacterium]|nr:tetratricopeptide repeat protein [Armatimonadota bacterium]